MKLRRGFSLIETMIAVLALSFTVLMFGAVFPAASKMRHKAENVTRATTLAQQKLEQLRAVGYQNLNYSGLLAAGVIDANPATQPYSFKNVSGLEAALPEAAGTLTITDEATDLKSASVQVTWGGTVGKNNSVVLATLLANKAMKVK